MAKIWLNPIEISKNYGFTNKEIKRFIGHGYGIHWEDLDEDISVENLLLPENKLLKARV